MTDWIYANNWNVLSLVSMCKYLWEMVMGMGIFLFCLFLIEYYNIVFEKFCISIT